MMLAFGRGARPAWWCNCACWWEECIVTSTTLVAVGCWNKERMECKGVSVSGGARVGEMRMRTKVCGPCLA